MKILNTYFYDEIKKYFIHKEKNLVSNENVNHYQNRCFFF